MSMFLLLWCFDIEMFVLHFIFVLRINLAVSEFCSASNLRPVRNEHN